MLEKCFIDASALLEIILWKRTELLRKLSNYVSYTSVNVLEEAAFKIIYSSIAEDKIGFFKMKEKFEKDYSIDVLISRLHVLNLLKNYMLVLEITEQIFDTAKKIITEYRLLPNDALIAATCKHYGIRKIATFDDDFKRVDFLEILEL
ncbi:MAG: type II toxin-antitoxin system VapC family toxin [Archaeoglobaceae archaeon]